MRESPRVLVVDEHPTNREKMVFALQQAGYRTTEAATGEAALAEVARAPFDFDLIVLDLALPGIDGWDTYRRIRQHSDAPVVFVTASTDDLTMLRALEVGGAACIAKPFGPAVFVARVAAVLRRAETAGGRRTIRLGEAEVDLAGAVVWRDGERTALTAGECRMLETLARQAPRFVTAEELAMAVNSADQAESENPAKQIKIRISRLRRKIEPRPQLPRHLLSARGRGYRLALEDGCTEAGPAGAVRL